MKVLGMETVSPWRPCLRSVGKGVTRLWMSRRNGDHYETLRPDGTVWKSGLYDVDPLGVSFLISNVRKPIPTRIVQDY